MISSFATPMPQMWIEPPLPFHAPSWGRATTDLRAPLGGSKRAREFAAGRRCATQALTDAGARDVLVGVGPERRPCWPVGFIGSITHTTTFAWAVVARAGSLRSLGIDSEAVFDDAALREAAPIALDEHEWRLVRRGHEAEGATLVFSAKESLFKCVNPCIGVFFEFADARVERISAERDDAGSFELRLLRDLAPEFPLGRRFVGRYAIGRGHLHTAVELAA